jgi:hypothetical protein
MIREIAVRNHRLKQATLPENRELTRFLFPHPTLEDDMTVNKYSLLFRFACRCLKYYLLFLVGFILSCLLAKSLGVEAIAVLLFQVARPILPRLTVLIACFFAISIILESLRY